MLLLDGRCELAAAAPGEAEDPPEVPGEIPSAAGDTPRAPPPVVADVAEERSKELLIACCLDAMG
jgi:hypothetical protein